MGGSVTLRAMVVSKDIKAGVIWGGVVAPYPDIFGRGNNPGSRRACHKVTRRHRRHRAAWVSMACATGART